MALGLCFALVAGSAVDAFAAAGRPEAAICLVCHVEEGTNAAEPVRATRTHEGREYHFCSDRCADRFEKDPARYLAAARVGMTAVADSAAGPGSAAGPDSAAGPGSAAAPPDSGASAGTIFPRLSTAPT